MPEPKGKFSIVCKAGEAEITLYDVIDSWFGISVRKIRDELKAAGEVKRIRVRINSPGGSITEGTAIYNLLRSHPARVLVTIDGLAASMASIVAMAGDQIEIGEGAYIMVHDPTGLTWGDAEEVRAFADLLDKMKGQLVGIYARRTGQSEEQISKWMEEETWMTADEAVKNGFANRAVAGLKVAAVFDCSKFRHAPDALFSERKEVMSEEKSLEKGTPGPASYKEIKAACAGADEKFICAQLDAEATTEQARNAWTAEQNRRIEALQKERDDAKKEAEKAKGAAPTPKPGVDPLGTATPEGKAKTPVSGDAIEVFNALVAGYEAKGMKRPKAMAKAVAEHPEEHRAYLAAYNEQHGRKLRGTYAGE